MDEVHVLNVLLGLGTGGAERSTVDLAGRLVDHGVHLHLQCRGERRVGAQADVDQEAVDISFVDDGRWLPWLRAIRRGIGEVRADVVHTVLYQADVAGRLASIGTGVPVLTSLVNTSYAPARRADPAIVPWKLEATRRIEGLTARRLTRAFHALTPTVAEAAVSDLGVDPARITVVPRGREEGRLAPRTPERRAVARRDLGLDGDAPVVLHVGRQEYQKAHDTLVAAFARVRGELPTARLVLAGRAGNATAAMEAAIAAHGVAGSVVRTGHVDDVASLHWAADVFAFPSRFEGQGGAAVEALALATPIVASDIGPIRETVGTDAAVLVAPDDPRALADALVAVLGDPARRTAMGRAGRARFEAEYSIDAVATRMAALYREVAGARRRP